MMTDITQRVQKIRRTLDIARMEIETLCKLAPAAKLTSISVERHSLAAHHALNSYLNQIMAFFDPKEKTFKTSFRVISLDENKDRFLQEIKSRKYNSRQQTILRFAYEKSNALGDKSLTFLREVGNEERHKLLMEKLILSDKGWKIGKAENYVLACWKGSTCEAIESDFNFLLEQNRYEKPSLPQRTGKRRTSRGCVVIFKKGDTKDNFFKKLNWLPGALISNKGATRFYGSSIHSFGGGSIFLSREASIHMENCKIIMEDGTFHGDLFIKDGKLNTIPYDRNSLEFTKRKIKSFIDRNVFVSFGNEKINLIGYLLSAYRICEDVFTFFKTLV